MLCLTFCYRNLADLESSIGSVFPEVVHHVVEENKKRRILKTYFTVSFFEVLDTLFFQTFLNGELSDRSCHK